MSESLETRILELRTRDGRYSKNAYFFVLDALDHTQSLLTSSGQIDRHIGGKELLEGIRNLATDRFGALAKEVFNQWGILSTEDFGQVVFNLVHEGLLQRRAQDSLLDFANGYDFAREFEADYDFHAAWEKLHQS